MRVLICLIATLAVLIILTPRTFATDSAAPVLNLKKDTILSDNAFNFPTGDFGTSINGQTFQNEAIVTFNGWQYGVYWSNNNSNNKNPRPTVSRRKLPDGEWQSIIFEDYSVESSMFAYNGNVHNVMSIGIGSDGYIHLAYDHHCNKLNYRKSKTPLALNPETADWSASSFSSTGNSLGEAGPIYVLTYPLFFNTPNGGLQFAFRNGNSGEGDWLLYKYEDKGSGIYDWRFQGLLFSREGIYTPSGKSKRCAYPNQFRYDSKGRLHTTWVWREQGTNTRGNHDICYAYSDDQGETWYNNAGVKIATLNGTADSHASAISVDSPGHVVHPVKFDMGLMNQGTMFLDKQDRPHLLVWRNPSETTGTVDFNLWRYYHYWREADGTWKEDQLPFWGRKPQTMLDESGNIYVLFGQGNNLIYGNNDPGTVLSIARASEAGQWKDWELTHVYADDKWFHGEPLYDLSRWVNEGILSVYFQERPIVAGQPSSLHVMDFEVGTEIEEPVTKVGFVFEGGDQPPPPQPTPDPEKPVHETVQEIREHDIVAQYENIAHKYGSIYYYSDQQNETYSAKNIINGKDNDNEDRWAADGVTKNHNVIIDLGAQRTFSAAQLHTVENRKYQFYIEASSKPDGDYTLIVDRRNHSQYFGPYTYLFKPVTARYVRFIVTGVRDATSTWVSIRELKILSLPIKYQLESVKVESSTVKATLTSDIQGGDRPITVVCAVYSNDMLTHIETKLVTYAEPTLVIDFDIPAGGDQARVMLWDGEQWWNRLHPATATGKVELNF